MDQVVELSLNDIVKMDTSIAMVANLPKGLKTIKLILHQLGILLCIEKKYWSQRKVLHSEYVLIQAIVIIFISIQII